MLGQLVLELHCYRVRLGQRHRCIHRHIEFGSEPVSHPARAYV